MKRWQSYRRPNFRSQPILSEFFASQTAIKKCLNAGVDYTVLHAIIHADWPVQMLAVAIASLGRSSFDPPKSCDQPASPNFALLGDQNPNPSLTAFKQGEERDSKSRRKKKEHGAVFPPCVQLQVVLNWSAAMIVVALRAEDCFKNALNSKLWRKEQSICTLLMIEQTLISLAFTYGQPKLTKLWKKDLPSLPTQTARHISRRSRWKHKPVELRELSARVTDPSGSVLPCCSHKHVETFESNIGRRETCLLAMRVGLDRSRFPGSYVTPGAPARK